MGHGAPSVVVVSMLGWNSVHKDHVGNRVSNETSSLSLGFESPLNA